MRVTPEQSRIVQQTLFNNGYKWKDSSTKVVLEQKTVLCLENCIRWTNEELFEGKNLPELTFQEFFDRYVKWCVMGCVEVSEWASKHFGCHAYVSKDKHLCVLESYSHYSFCDSSEKKLSDYVELTFEQFEKYVLKSKDMDKVIGYRLKEDCKKYIPALDAISPCFSEGDYEITIKGVFFKHFKKAGVLDLWFEPVYESKELYFGKVKFTIHEGYADTEYGKVTKEEVKNAIDYIKNPPKLNDYTLGVKIKYTTYPLSVIEKSNECYIAFGSQEGTVKELEDIYKAM